MKHSRVSSISCIILISIAAFILPASAQIESVLSHDTITAGLKEALHVGVGNAIDIVSKKDGFYKNPAIKILLPENVRDIENILDKAGFESLVDEFELSMNRAAEQAASVTGELFVNAIKEMTIEDAVNIFEGEDHAATLYFQEKMTEPLQEKFQPIVEKAMSEVGVTRLYQALEDGVNKAIPLGLGEIFDIDLGQYVTEKALNGLFLMVAEEERKIREDPEARITEILRQVFK